MNEMEGVLREPSVNTALRLAREALNAVEWFEMGDTTRNWCLWCEADEASGHTSHCLRQRALAALEAAK